MPEKSTVRDSNDATGLATLEVLANALGNLSMSTTDMPTTWRLENASLAFSKIAMTSLTFLRLIPGSTYYAPVRGLAMWDISAAAVQCRCLIEGYHVLVYLIYEPVEPEKSAFQQILWRYHCELERHKMLRAAVPDSQHLQSGAEKLADLRAKLESDPVFRSHSQVHQQRLLKGEFFKLDDNIALSRKVGISENFFRYTYKYCSAFAHSAPFSISQLREFSAGSEDAKRLMKTLVEFACAYSAMALREFSALFPDQLLKLSPEVQRTIAIWEGIVRWEESANPGGPPS